MLTLRREVQDLEFPMYKNEAQRDHSIYSPSMQLGFETRRDSADYEGSRLELSAEVFAVSVAQRIEIVSHTCVLCLKVLRGSSVLV